jgi:leucyl-tRNA synthetase
MEYGTGAIFGCPAHDQRDLDFVNKYGLGNTVVVCPPDADPATFVVTDVAYDGEGRMINSRFLDGMTIAEAKEEVARRLEAETRNNRAVAERKVNFRLRDWGISRQRYWGCPIPVIHCDDCGVVPVPKDQLPVELPEDVTFDVPGNPLDRHPTWRQVACPQCGKAARRETDTMDTFVDSSWHGPCGRHGRRALPGPVHARDGGARDLSCSRRLLGAARGRAHRERRRYAPRLPRSLGRAD